jgi:predicted pyridoxine 5'-phosphate oxidase superfamily flavin-nucleotide-binding protein
MPDPFHEGERAVQEQTGERDIAVSHGRLIADRMPAGAKHFIAQQNYCALGWASPNGDIWASFLAGPEGFVAGDDEGAMLRLRLSNENGALTKTPPFSGLLQGDQLGALFIEFSTRRRLRVNGQVTMLSDDEMYLTVAEAFPNCPKYIQRRELVEQPATTKPTQVLEGGSLSGDLVNWIRGADTFFVASAYPDGPVDVSHRGGKPGFIQLRDDALHVPDYPGNSMFGTLGNFAANPRAGLVFFDYETNRQLQLTGEVNLNLSAGEVDGETGGTGRWWTFRPHKWIVSPLNRSFSWGLADVSPFNP